jgi:hypothetical protein
MKIELDDIIYVTQNRINKLTDELHNIENRIEELQNIQNSIIKISGKNEDLDEDLTLDNLDDDLDEDLTLDNLDDDLEDEEGYFEKIFDA